MNSQTGRAAKAAFEITKGRKGGRIAIQFYSDEDFERLYELLVRAGKV